MKFSISITFFGLILIAISFFCWKILPNKKELWRIIPRDRTIGTVLGAICLIWSAMNAYPLFEGNAARFRSLLGPAVIGITLLSFFYLDYLFTRALGGIILLSVSWLLHEAFVINIPIRQLFSIICYSLGIASFFLIAAPYRFRDMLEKISKDGRWRTVVSIVILSMGCLLILISISNHVL